MLKTVIYQSFRTENVPPWIETCMATVRAWAALKGFDYHFVDDRMFSYAPDWYREKVRNNVLLVSDLARLEIAKELLAKGYDRTIWVDADIVVFDPERFEIEVNEEFAFTRELWMWRNRFGQTKYSARVCNAVTVMVKGNSILDFYIYACKSLVRNPDWKVRFSGDTSLRIKAKHFIDRYRYTYRDGVIPPSFVGTIFLSRLLEHVDLPLLKNVGLLNAEITREIVKENQGMLADYTRKWNSPIYAANMCGSMYAGQGDGVLVAAIDKLIATKGAILNPGY